MISNELSAWCREYEFERSVIEFIGGVEKSYNEISKLEKNEFNKEKISMNKWIFNNTTIKELKGLSDRDKFLFGLGVLSNELLICMQKHLNDYM